MEGLFPDKLRVINKACRHIYILKEEISFDPQKNSRQLCTFSQIGISYM